MPCALTRARWTASSWVRTSTSPPSAATAAWWITPSCRWGRLGPGDAQPDRRDGIERREPAGVDEDRDPRGQGQKSGDRKATFLILLLSVSCLLSPDFRNDCTRPDNSDLRRRRVHAPGRGTRHGQAHPAGEAEPGEGRGLRVRRTADRHRNQFDSVLRGGALLFVIFDVSWRSSSRGRWCSARRRAADESQPVAVRTEAAKNLQLPGSPRMSEVEAATPPEPAAAKSLAWVAFGDIMVFFGVLLVGFAYLWPRRPEMGAAAPRRMSQCVSDRRRITWACSKGRWKTGSW